MYQYNWYQWLIFFFIYCFFGWIIESLYVSVKSRHFVNRGFLRLPLLPLYGSGAVVMLWVSLPFEGHLIAVFLSGMVSATILEYVTGWAMERLFQMKYWDYGGKPFNVKGYICLGTSLAWGCLTIILTEFVHRPVEQAVVSLSPALAMGISCSVFLLFAADTVKSTKEALDLLRVLESMTRMKAELEELQIQIALLKAETADRLTNLRDEQLKRAFSLRKEAAGKITAWKEETALRTGETLQALRRNAEKRLAAASLLKENAGKALPDLSSLTERLQSVMEKREKLTKHFSFYRKGLLKSNPTASSRKFDEALKELREWLKR